MSRPTVGMAVERGASLQKLDPCAVDRSGIRGAVPRSPEPAGPRGGAGVEALGVAIEERVELRPVRALGLRIDVPCAGAPRPLRPDERVLAADEVDGARPEQPVVDVLGDERDRIKRQAAPMQRVAGVRHVAAVHRSSAPEATPSGTKHTTASSPSDHASRSAGSTELG